MTQLSKRIGCNLCGTPITVMGYEEADGRIRWDEKCPMCGNCRVIYDSPKLTPSATFGESEAKVYVSKGKGKRGRGK